MVFPVVGGTQDTGYEISNSLRFNDDDSPSMTIASLGSSSSNAKKWTVSFWAKLSSGLGGHRCVFSAGESSGGNYVQLNFTDGDELQLYSSNALGEANNTATNIKTNAKYRDVSAWYHVVWAIDTTQSTNTNRIKLYVNGAQVTSFVTANNYPAQNTDNDRVGANNIDHFIGKFVDSSSQYVDGYLSDFYFIDGDAKSYTDFGETNDNGVWIPKRYAGSYGNNGFKLEFKQTGTSANSSGIGADTSGNDNHFSVSNLAAIDVTTDTPTNNFATLNFLDTNSNHTFSEGNCKIAYSASAGNFGVTKSTMGVAKGKWYWEIKYTYGNAGQFGVFDINDTETNTADIFTAAGNSTFEGLAWRIDSSNNIKECADGQTDDTNVDFSSGNILGIAFDADNGKIYGYNNGTELTSQDISAGTSLITAVTVSDFYLPFISNGDGGSGTKTGTSEINFGNPTFSISSGNSDANGYGNFEYSVPSGYYALCTKNLAEYG